MMTTGILDALVRLFALFAAGRTPREAMYGRQAAERYLAGRLSYEYTQAYLKQYDAEIARMNKRMPHSDDERLLAKRRSKLSVRLLVLCQQIIVELDIVSLDVLDITTKDTPANQSKTQFPQDR